MSAHPNVLLDRGTETMAVEKLTQQLEAGSIEPLPDSVRALERQSDRRFNLDPIELFSDEANDHTMQQYWRPVEGWGFKDSQAANAQAREVLAHRYEQLSTLAVLPNSALGQVSLSSDVVSVRTFDNIQVPLERVIGGASIFNFSGSWEIYGGKSFDEGGDYLSEESAGVAVRGASEAISIEYALRHHGRRTNWQEGIGMPITLRTFIDSSGETWFIVLDGSHRLTADKLLGRKVVYAGVEVPVGSNGELLPRQVEDDIARRALNLPRDNGN